MNKTLWLNNLQTITALNAKISMVVLSDEATIYLLLHNLHGWTFNSEALHTSWLVTSQAKDYVKGNRKL